MSEGSGEFVRRMPLAWGDDLHLATRLAEFWGSVVSLAPDWGILLLPILVCAALTAMRVALGDMLKVSHFESEREREGGKEGRVRDNVGSCACSLHNNIICC